MKYTAFQASVCQAARRLMTFAALVLSVSALHAQTTFTARILDAETGEALPLVGVYVNEENNTLTNFDGEFSITADSADLVRLTCIGRETMMLRAGTLTPTIKMRMLTATLSEVTVTAIEGILTQVAKKTEKAFNRKKSKTAQYFYRQTSVFTQRQDIVEAFVYAHSAVNLRDLTFLTGRHGLLTQAAWERSNISDMNLHHILELGPMTFDANFWKQLTTPLPKKTTITNRINKLTYIDYFQKYYDITFEEAADGDQQLFIVHFQRREDVEIKQPVMTGTLYVDRATLNPLAFDGQVENMKLSFGKGGLRSATVVPVTLDYHLDYRYDHKYPEVADLSMQAKWGDFQTRTMLFNVEGQTRLTRRQLRKKSKRVRENMLSSIAEAGYDSTFWANNEVIKRTAEEMAIAQGSVDLAQARLDSLAAYQASLSPLARFSDRIERFGQAIPQEKVYVHMDNTGYFLGDTIWFAAYTRRTNDDQPSRISKVLYAELWNHDGYLVERKLVEMKDGRGSGFFALPDTLYSGYFELRAYTRWQLNWGQTEHYHAWHTEYMFYNKAMAKDFFRDYEKLYSRVFPVYDKPKQEGDFYKDMTFRPLRRYFKSAPKEPELRLSLFPEGGNLVAGVPCRVAFEAATSEGEVKEGTLTLIVKKEKAVSEKTKKGKGRTTETIKDKELLSVRTENRGRGTFTFTPQVGGKYKAVFTPDEQPKNAKKPLTVSQDIKDIKAEGVALQVHRDTTSGDWYFDIAAAGQAAQTPLGITVMNEGKLVHFEEIRDKRLEIRNERLEIKDEPSLTTHLTFHISTPGVHQVTVFDSIGHIYADRLFFVTTPELTQPTLQFTGQKEQYEPFEAIDFDVTSAHLMPEQTVSLTVRDAVHADNTFDSGNIMTEMLLASEIKGFVPQPDYFFERDDEEHRRALDLLMMTQGWRRFNWQEIAIRGAWEITHPAEHTQIVTGTVNRYWVAEDFFNQVDVDHERFMTEQAPSLTEQQNIPLFNADGRPTAFKDNMLSGFGRPNMAWNLSPIYEQRSNIGAISDTWHGIFSNQGHSWDNTDYNQLSFKTNAAYRKGLKQQQQLAARRYIETGTVKKEVRVHAEFVNLYDERNTLVGETETTKGAFQIDLPRFDGQCVFFLGAADTTLWKKKWEGFHRRKPYTWIQMDTYNEYDLMAQRLPDYPEYYVRLNFPYPRWIKPYTYYQVHNAPLRDTTYLSPRLLTDGTHLLDQITVRARHGGLRHIDFSKPAYVIDAYEALNLGLDAGVITPSSNPYCAAIGAARALVSDMAQHRHWEVKTYNENMGEGYWWGPLERLRFYLLTNIDKIYIYTDYSPRREGDERFDQDNQPIVAIDLRRYPDKSQRVVYRDRRYILDGFAFQEDFYHPDYRRNPPKEGQKDYRRTLYWNPDLKLDASGRAHVHLFNNSQRTTIAIDAAGQTSEGGLLYSGDKN